MISEQIGEGSAVVEKEDVDSPVRFVTIKQGKARFFSPFSESPNGIYLLAFADGHSERIGNQEKWVDGQVCLIKDSKTVLWSKRLGRPMDGKVSDNGKVAINDSIKMKRTLGGKFYVFDEAGKLLVEREFDSNLNKCAISKDGNYAVVSTAVPDNSIYLFDVVSGALKWQFKNPPSMALDLSFSQNYEILVYTRRREGDQSYDYSLTLEGKLSEESAKEFEKLKQIKEGKESLNALVSFLGSPNSSKILNGLNTIQSLFYREDRKFSYHELIPHLLPHIESSDPQISRLSIKLLLQAARKSPESAQNVVPRIIKKCKSLLNTRFEGEYAIMTLGEIGALNSDWANEVMPFIIDRLENSLVWNERRFAAFAIGQIGKVNPDLVKKAIPILTRYLGNSDWWLPQVEESQRETMEVKGIKITIDMGGLVGGPNPEVWVRDAALGTLGDIGENFPEVVKESISLIVSCLQRPEPYTRKKAIIALGQIAKKGRSYIESVIPALEKIAEHDSDQKVRFEAKRVLESVSPRAAELSVSNIPKLIASLSSEDKLIRYRSLRELERMFHARSSLPEKYYNEALQVMKKSSSDLVQCIERIEEELSVSEDETTRSLLLESLLMAKRTFLEFIAGEFIGIDSLKCRFCGKVYKAGGLRNHLSKAHPEKWKDIRPYNDVIQKHLEVKNLSGLSFEEWERQLLEKYENIS
jgi:hypothetical protein